MVSGRIGTATTASNGGSLLASADFHGMEVEVVRCADVARVGLRGIVVRETRSTLTIVCSEKESKPEKLKGVDDLGEGVLIDKVRMILKKGATFRVCITLPQQEMKSEEDTGDGEVAQRATREVVFELNGSMLEIRPADRSSKKFKFRWKMLEGSS